MEMVIMNNFFEYSWHDGDIDRIEISSNQISIVVLNDDNDKPVTIKCHDVVGLTNLCMWEDTIICNATLECVKGELPPFLQEVKNAHLLDEVGYNNQPIRNNLLCLSIKLVNDIVFNIYCYSVDIVDFALKS